MRITYIGKFEKLWDEEHIARSFEALGHTVSRVPEALGPQEMLREIDTFKPDLVIFAKFRHHTASYVIESCKRRGIRTACWVFDLYFGYTRENQLREPAFTADYVFTTDGGSHPWSRYGITRHRCVRQGIYEPECYVAPSQPKEHDVLFVGTHNASNPERLRALAHLASKFKLDRVGDDNPDAVRGTALNDLYAKTRVVVGDSVYSPGYWSNRVVETLGRGGFLIHVDVPGLREEYPDLVTYPRGDHDELERLVRFYLANDGAREAIIQKNFELVRSRYTCAKKCAELLAQVAYAQ